MGAARALRIVYRAYAAYPAAHRLHILIRFLTCPFTRVLDDVPAGARLLEIGSGHAVFARLAVEERARQAIAVDPDLRKSLLPSPSPRVRKVAGYDACVRGAFDAVVIVDVAYRLSNEEQRALFARGFALLRPGGTLLVKEMDPSHRLKMTWTRVQEWLNEKLLGITLGTGVVMLTREEIDGMLRGIGFTDFRARAIDSGYLHPHMLYTATKPT
jgi:cyclopropane fatty-acyl-phospholipid synthase-like methyltransferase